MKELIENIIKELKEGDSNFKVVKIENSDNIFSTILFEEDEKLSFDEYKLVRSLETFLLVFDQRYLITLKREEKKDEK